MADVIEDDNANPGWLAGMSRGPAWRPGVLTAHLAPSPGMDAAATSQPFLNDEMLTSRQSFDENDFLEDRDYEWLTGYDSCSRSGQCGAAGRQPAPPRQHRCPELLGSRSYEELSNHVDATLAEIDMEQFCRADMDRVLEISACSDHIYGEQALFSNISMDSLDCSSFEVDDFLESIEADQDNEDLIKEVVPASSSDGHITNGGKTSQADINQNDRVSGSGTMTSWPEQRQLASPREGRRVQGREQPQPEPVALLQLFTGRRAGSHTSGDSEPSSSGPAAGSDPLNTDQSEWTADASQPSVNDTSHGLTDVTSFYGTMTTSAHAENITNGNMCSDSVGPMSDVSAADRAGCDNDDEGSHHHRKQGSCPDTENASSPLGITKGTLVNDDLCMEKESATSRGVDGTRKHGVLPETQKEAREERAKENAKREEHEKCSNSPSRYHNSSGPCQKQLWTEDLVTDVTWFYKAASNQRRRGDGQNNSQRTFTSDQDNGTQSAAPKPAEPAKDYVCFPPYVMPGLPFLDKCPIQAGRRESSVEAAAAGGSPRRRRESSVEAAAAGCSPRRRPRSSITAVERQPSSRGASPLPRPCSSVAVQTAGLSPQRKPFTPAPFMMAGQARVPPQHSPVPGHRSPVGRPQSSITVSGSPRRRPYSPLAGYHSPQQRCFSPVSSPLQRSGSPASGCFSPRRRPMSAVTTSPLRRPASVAGGSPHHRPVSCGDIKTMLRGSQTNVRDWTSLRLLLPREFRQAVDSLSGEESSSPTNGDSLHSGQCASVRHPGLQTEHRRLGTPGGSDGSVESLRSRQTSGRDVEAQRRGSSAGSSNAGSVAGSERSLPERWNEWFTDAAEFAAAAAKDLRAFTGGSSSQFSTLDEHTHADHIKEQTETKPSHGRVEQKACKKQNTRALLKGKSGAAFHRLLSADSGIEMRTEPLTSESSGSEKSGSIQAPKSPSHPRRVVVVCKDGFGEIIRQVNESVNDIVAYFYSGALSVSTNTQDGAPLRGDSRRRPAAGYLVLDKLCPSLYALLGDGLLIYLPTAFGPVHSSVWAVVEAACPQGTSPAVLTDLVLKINNEDGLSESILKFNAFVFGLLNMRALDWWFWHLLTRQTSVLHKHYSASALLRQLGPETAPLLRQLGQLARFSFSIELTFESRQLQHSLWRIGQKLRALDVTSWGSQTTSKRRERPEQQAKPQLGQQQRGRLPSSAELDQLCSKWRGMGVDNELVTALWNVLSNSRLLHRDENCNEDAQLTSNTQREVNTSQKTRVNDNEKTPRTIDILDNNNSVNSDQPNSNETSSTSLSGSLQRSGQAPGTPGRQRAKQLEDWWQRVVIKDDGVTPWWEKMVPASPSPVRRQAQSSHPSSPSRLPRPSAPSPSSRPGVPPAPGSYRPGPAQQKQSPPAPRRRTQPRQANNQTPAGREEQSRGSTDLRHRAPDRKLDKTATKTDEQPVPAAICQGRIKMVPKQQFRKVRSLVPYRAANGSYLSYERNDTLTVIGTTGQQWLLCARGRSVGLVTRRHVIDIT